TSSNDSRKSGAVSGPVPGGVRPGRPRVSVQPHSAGASRGPATAATRRARPSPLPSPNSSGPSSRSRRAATRTSIRTPASTLAAALLGLDEDVDLVRSLVALMIGDRERRGVLAHLPVGVDRILVAALRSVAEVPTEGERAPALLLDRRGELHLERRRASSGSASAITSSSYSSSSSAPAA